MSNQVRVAVIGTGSLGKEHARIYADLAKAGEAEFTGVFDVNPEAARTHAARWGVRAFTSVAEAAAGSDALSVVTPTVTHHAIARELLQAGRHVLVEKPMTDSSEQAEDLVRLAQ
ncbi:MAG: Gfo/Idh/MocA family protein, partial [Verrucomicrobiota bacterium]